MLLPSCVRAPAVLQWSGLIPGTVCGRRDRAGVCGRRIKSVMKRPDVPIPTGPGVYLFKDSVGRVLYVGKAKSLRSRLGGYFQDSARLPPKTVALLQAAADVEWVLAQNEVSALMLEYSFIKEHRPRFNIRLKDDKSYPYLALTVNQEWPRPMVVRGRKRKGVRYFGPYPQAYAIRDTLDSLLRPFPLRTCSDAKFRRHARMERPCLFYHIDRCCGPCVGRVGKEDYDLLVEEMASVLSGRARPVILRLQSEMQAAAERLDFEFAARLRDQLRSVEQTVAQQQIVLDQRENLDFIGVYGDRSEFAVHVFFVRAGRIAGQKAFLVENPEEKCRSEVLRDILLLLYGDGEGIPDQVELPWTPDEAKMLEKLLTRWRGERDGPVGDGRTSPHTLTTGDPVLANHGRTARTVPASGRSVRLHIPQRGPKRALLETVTRNAEQFFAESRLRRQADHNARARALNELREALYLSEAPLRIECFDISQVQGAYPVASLVVFEDGLPKKRDYRHFSIKTVEGQDDFAMMREALTRRFTNYVKEREARERGSGQPSGFAYPPGLLLIDGGRGHLNVALEVLDELGLAGEIPAAGLAKRFEEIILPDQSAPVRLPGSSEALYLLQRVRDETHRFAITHHRSRRGKGMTVSVLDMIPGVGPKRRTRLLRRFGSVAEIRKASVEEIAATPGVPLAVAQAVQSALDLQSDDVKPDDVQLGGVQSSGVQLQMQDVSGGIQTDTQSNTHGGVLPVDPAGLSKGEEEPGIGAGQQAEQVVEGLSDSGSALQSRRGK